MAGPLVKLARMAKKLTWRFFKCFQLNVVIKVGIGLTVLVWISLRFVLGDVLTVHQEWRFFTEDFISAGMVLEIAAMVASMPH